MGKSAAKSSTKVGGAAKAKVGSKAAPNIPLKPSAKAAERKAKKPTSGSTLPRSITDPSPKKAAVEKIEAAVKSPSKSAAAELSATDSTAAASASFGAGKTSPISALAKELGVTIKLPSPLEAIMADAHLEPNAQSVRCLVTPELAARILELNQENRYLATTQSRRHSQAMIRDRWIENGDTIRFDITGKLIDGQHRLAAIVMANKAVWCELRFNLPLEAQATIDTGRRRSVADQLHINGENYSKVLAGTIGWLFRLGMDDMGYRVETQETLDFLDNNKLIRESVAFVAGKGKPIKGTVATLLAAIHYIGSEILDDKEKADRFVDVFKRGYPGYDGDPAHKLREKNLELMAARQMRTDRAHADLLIYAWNLHRQDKTSRSIEPKGTQRIEGYNPAKLGISPERGYNVEPFKLPTGQTVERRI